MIENRSPRSDLLAVVLLVLTVFLSASLLTYDPADRVGTLFRPFDGIYQADVLRWPQNIHPTNAFGHAGVLASNILYTTIGLGAWLLVVGVGAVVIALLHKKPIHTLWTRWIGWLLALCGLTTTANLLFPWLTPGPIVGPGGYLGALGAGVLKQHFSQSGGLILAGSVLMIGLFMWTEYMLVRVAGAIVVAIATAFSFALPRGSLGKLRRVFKLPSLPVLSRAARIRKPRTKADVDESIDKSLDKSIDNTDIAISTGRPSIVADVDDDELFEAWNDPVDEDDVEVDDESATIPFMVKTAASSALASEVETETTIERDDEVAGTDAVPAARRSLFGRKHKTKLTTPPANPNTPSPNVKKPVDERTAVISQLNAASLKENPADYDLPSIDLLKVAVRIPDEHIRQQTLRRGKMLEQKFLEFGYKVKVVDIDTGPVITQYELELETGLRLSKIMGLSDDIAIGLRVPSVRIVAPIPGKNSVGIEVPNETRQMVQLRDVMEASTEQTRKMKIPLFLGQDVSGNTLVADLSKLPHLLIAGRTGTGKSVCLNAIISSILMTRRPDEVRMLMIDPKMVELSGYSRLPHLMHPVVTDMRKAEAILAWAVEKMEERYRLMARAGVRHLNSYNQLGEEELMDRLQPEDDDERAAIPINMPFIVIIADEMADLMMTAGKEVEQHIIRLAQKSRAVGIHLILATQKPTVDVVTGLIKSNLPARIAFQVASQTDSRVVLDSNGAEKLLGNGDMLFLGPGSSTLLRGQGTYLSDDEIDAITEAVSTGEQNFVNELVNIRVAAEGDTEQFSEKLKNRDELYHRAVETVIGEERGSVSLLQRVLGVGYGRAARLIDFMEEDGVVGPYNGSKSRDIIMTMDQWLHFKSVQNGETSTPLPPDSPLATRGRSTTSSSARAMADTKRHKLALSTRRSEIELNEVIKDQDELEAELDEKGDIEDELSDDYDGENDDEVEAFDKNELDDDASIDGDAVNKRRGDDGWTYEYVDDDPDEKED